MDYFQLICAIGAVLLALYYYYTSNFGYWKVRNIVGPRPVVLAGNLGEILFKKISISDKLRQMYDEYKNEPVFGIFEGTKPVLVVNDLDLIKDVLIKDFSVFVDRGFLIFPKAEPLGEHLFALEAERWRPMRAKLSPIFTSGKLKDMVPLMLECSRNLERYVDKVARAGKPVECRDLAAKFTTDVIGSCAFGINMNALEDERSEFREIGKKLFAQTPRLQARDICRQFLPNFYSLFGRFLQPPGVDQFLTDVITDTIKYRRQNNIVRPDFVNALIEIQDHPEKLENINLTPEFIAAQAFVFFTAGFETSSTSMSHALYELARNQNVQDKLRKEIRETYEKHGGEITYDALKEMKYLDKVFKEVLRMYPLLSMLTREVSEKYTFRGTKITIEKGTIVWIPAYGIQRDSNIYPDPDKFDPERFNEDAVASRHPMSYLAFGNGPRNCIGARFAYCQSKIGLATIIRNYKVNVCEKTKIPYESDPYLFLLTLRGGVHLKITKAES